MPFVAGHPVVTVQVEVLKPVVPIVVFLILAEELRPRQDAVVIVIRAAKPFSVEMPFVARNAAVAVMVDIGEPARGPIIEPVLALVRVERPIVGRPRRSFGPDPHLVAGEFSVTVPVVDGERPIAAVPFRAGDRAVVVAIHLREADRRVVVSTTAAAALCGRLVRQDSCQRRDDDDRC